MGAAWDFKFGVRIRRLAYKPKNAKVGQMGWTTSQKGEPYKMVRHVTSGYLIFWWALVYIGVEYVATDITIMIIIYFAQHNYTQYNFSDVN